MKSSKNFHTFDKRLIALAKHYADPMARASFFIVFFWFGILKVIGISPAADLVAMLLNETLPFLPEQGFLIFFGVFEMLVGLVFLLPRATRLALFLLVLHMIATFLPLIFLGDVGWQGAFTPTLEGQYIIKNFVILALALQIGVHLRPLEEIKKRPFGRSK